MPPDAPPPSAGPGLEKTLGPIMLWGLGVGYVISGEYFGWNLGLPLGGTYGMLAATLLITAMYVAFVFSYAELSCSMPRAGGVFVYGARALGPFGGFVAGLVQLVEFVFAPPAIAMAIAAYVAQRFSGVVPEHVAIVAYFVFTALNIWGVRQAASFELLVTVLAVVELGIFIGVVGPSFSWAHFTQDPLPHGWTGVFACLPFAIWFYLAIEGVANVAEESRRPQHDIPRGFGAAILTLVVLAVAVFFVAVGVGGWHDVVYAPGSHAASDAPLPLALAHVVHKGHVLYSLLLGIGLLGLVASFHGIILAAGRATMELGRAGFAPRWLGRIAPQRHTPVAALVANMVIGIAAILSGKTAQIITLSAFGALALYVIAMISLFVLRRTAPEMQRPYRALGYPWAPAFALGVAAISLVAMVWSSPHIAAVFAAILVGGALYYVVFVRRHAAATWLTGRDADPAA